MQKHKLSIALFCLLFSSAATAQTSSGGPYKINASVISGGGATSSAGGNKSITGTVGQSAAGSKQTNGSIVHIAGFWQKVLGQEAPQSGGQTTVQFSSANFQIQEQLGALSVTVTRSGDTSGTSSVSYETNDAAGTQKADFEYASGRLVFAPGETTKTIQLLVNEDMNAEFNETFGITLSKAVGATVGPQATATIMINDDSPEQLTNPIDDAQSFVYMQYHDFLNREPDAPGLAFWTNEITSCGADQNCIEARRVNVSGAFFLSIEFQETGYLVYRTFKAAFGSSGTPVPVKLHDFLFYTQGIGKGVIVNQPGWQETLEDNKQAFFKDFVSSELFSVEYDGSATPAAFVDNLFLNAGITPSPSERQAVIDQFGGSANTSDLNARAKALRMVAENGALVTAEFNRAFVLMQYFGYLRRNPSEAPEPGLNFDGYNFWLSKLDQFDGNFINAEMVKAFISSMEYRQRFGQ